MSAGTKRRLSIAGGGIGAGALLTLTRPFGDETRWLILAALIGIGLVTLIVAALRQSQKDTRSDPQ